MPAYAQLSDLQLIQDYRDHNEEAGNELARRYYPDVQKWCRYWLGYRAAAAQDAVQEVFMQVLAERRIFSYRGDAALSSWLYTVTRNTCLAHHRKKNQRRALNLVNLQDIPNDELIADANDPEKELERKDQHNILRAGLKTMPEKYLRIVHSFYLQENTPQEVCQTMRVNYKTLYVQLYRCRQLLRQRISRQLLAA
jgi:RNA polymerase sigma-70 factor (ECF subfamily)